MQQRKIHAENFFSCEDITMHYEGNGTDLRDRSMLSGITRGNRSGKSARPVNFWEQMCVKITELRMIMRVVSI